MQNRMKSWALWLALAALVIWLVKTVWKLDIAEPVNQFMNLLLPILVAFGIINNPTNPDGL